MLRARWHWSIPAVAIAGLLTPLLLTDSTFSADWGNHLWLIWAQGMSLRELGEPSYFLQSSIGAFYPYYAFYGGTIYVVLGALAWLATPEIAAIAAYAGALAAAYLGWTWIAKLVGIKGWPMQLPGCIAVTAPFAVTNLYGRGDIPEVIATSVIPLIVASAVSVVREPRTRLFAATAYVAGIVALTGSHTLTLVWGTTFLALLAALLLACYWQEVVGWLGRGLTLAGLTALGVGINAWILVPLVLYHTRLVEQEPDPIDHIAYTDPSQLFSPLRGFGDPYSWVTADINAQLPVLALLWALICGAACWRFLAPSARKLALGLLGLGGALLLLVLAPSLIDVLPKTLRFIQFPYRILTYVDLCAVGLVTLALAALQRAGSVARIPTLVLAAIAALNFGLSLGQSFEVRSWLSGRGEAVASPVAPPHTWYAPLQFADGSAPVVRPTLPPLHFPIERAQDSYAVGYPPGPAGTAETNVVTGTYMVDVSGARPVGRTREGQMVVRLPAAREPRRVEVRAGWGIAMSVGRWLSLLSLVAALLAAIVCARAQRRSASA